MRGSAWLAVLAACGGPVSVTTDAAPDGASDVDAQTQFTCGSGTHEQAGTCIADPRIDVRAPAQIVADGYTPVDLRVLAFDDNGDPVHDRMLLTTSRVSAGTIVSPLIAVGELGGQSTFVPCNAADGVTTTCAGPAHLSVSLESAPLTPLGGADVELVAPVPVDLPAACMVSGNVLHYDATNFSTTPSLHITTDGVFDVSGTADWVSVHVVANSVGWTLHMSSTKIGIPLVPSVYENAKYIGYDEAGDSAFYMDDGTCTPVSRFQVHSYVYDAGQNKVTSLLASFEQHCDSDPTRSRVGCVRFSQ